MSHRAQLHQEREAEGAISKLPATVAKSGVSLDLGMLARVRFDGGTAAERTFIAQRIAELWNLGAASDFTHLQAAPAAVRLALAVDVIRRELEDNSPVASELNDGAWLTEQQWQELTQLAAEVKATLEGRS